MFISNWLGLFSEHGDDWSSDIPSEAHCGSDVEITIRLATDIHVLIVGNASDGLNSLRTYFYSVFRCVPSDWETPTIYLASSVEEC